MPSVIKTLTPLTAQGSINISKYYLSIQQLKKSSWFMIIEVFIALAKNHSANLSDIRNKVCETMRHKNGQSRFWKARPLGGASRDQLIRAEHQWALTNHSGAPPANQIGGSPLAPPPPQEGGQMEWVVQWKARRITRTCNRSRSGAHQSWNR